MENLNEIFGQPNIYHFNGFLGLPWWLSGKELPAKQETQVQSLGLEDTLEKEMATPPSVLAWQIPWTEEQSGLQSMGSQGVGSLQFSSVAQSCPTLCNPMDCSPSGSSVCGILQTRILEWVAMPSSRGSSGPRDQTCISFISRIGR